MKNTQHILVVESLANSGDGVGRINQKVIFIPFVIPGEKIKVEITVDKKSFYKGRLVEILEPSPLRQKPPCPHFGVCGGCDWQHMEYQEQLRWKKKNLFDVLTRIGEIQDLQCLQAIEPSPLILHYRNRIQIQQDQRGPHYYQKGSNKPVYIEQCPLASQAINDWLLKNKDQLKGQKQKIEIAENAHGGVSTHKVNDLGQSELGFRQVNDQQNRFLIGQVLELIKQEDLKSVTDLYCGQGNWSLAIAKALPEVSCLGIDINPINISEAEKHKTANVKFILGDVMQSLSEWSDPNDLTIIDPPRAGCDPQVLESLCQRPSPWLVYISCHPATLARDLKVLLAGPWRLHSVTPVDMFPQTAHLECLAILRSTKGAKTADC